MDNSFFRSYTRCRYISLFSLSFSFTLSLVGPAKKHYTAGSLFCWLSQGLVIWPTLGDPFVSQISGNLCASYSLGGITGRAYIICLQSLLLFHLLGIFYTGAIWLFFAEVWVTPRLSKSSELSSVFKPTLTMMWFGWYSLLWFSIR